MRTLLAIGALALMGISWCGCASGPLYEGKPLSYWVKRLDDRSVEVRQKAAGAIGGFRRDGKSALPALLEAAAREREDHGDYRVVNAAESLWWAMERVDPEASQALCLNQLESPRAELRWAALGFLLQEDRRPFDPRIFPPIAKLEVDPDPQVRALAESAREVRERDAAAGTELDTES